jgi:chromate transporter
MIYLLLFIEFLIIGTFAIGGGLSSLPYFIALTEKYDWFSKSMLMDMVAISESTPGPIGINMATYVGYVVGKIPGSLIASFAMTISGFIFIIIIATYLEDFKMSSASLKVFYGLRPTIAALIGYAAFTMMVTVFSDMTLEIIPISATLILFVTTLLLMNKTKISPLTIIAVTALISLFIPL